MGRFATHDPGLLDSVQERSSPAVGASVQGSRLGGARGPGLLSSQAGRRARLYLLTSGRREALQRGQGRLPAVDRRLPAPIHRPSGRRKRFPRRGIRRSGRSTSIRRRLHRCFAPRMWIPRRRTFVSRRVLEACRRVLTFPRRRRSLPERRHRLRRARNRPWSVSGRCLRRRMRVPRRVGRPSSRHGRFFGARGRRSRRDGR
jgi:hypothetical protein